MGRVSRSQLAKRTQAGQNLNRRVAAGRELMTKDVVEEDAAANLSSLAAGCGPVDTMVPLVK